MKTIVHQINEIAVERLLIEHKDLLAKYSEKKAIRRFKIRNWIRRIVLGLSLATLTFGLFQILSDMAWHLWRVF